MNKEQILILAKPLEEIYKILRKEKTLELSFEVPIEYRGWVYLYCSMAGDNSEHLANQGLPRLDEKLMGKIPFRYWYDSDTINKLDYDDMSYDDGYEDWDGSWVSRPVKDEGYLIRLGEIAEAGFVLEDFDKLIKEHIPRPIYLWKMRKLEKLQEALNLTDFSNLFYDDLIENGSSYAYIDREKEKK